MHVTRGRVKAQKPHPLRVVDQGVGGCTHKVLDQGVQRMSGRPNAGRSTSSTSLSPFDHTRPPHPGHNRRAAPTVRNSTSSAPSRGFAHLQYLHSPQSGHHLTHALMLALHQGYSFTRRVFTASDYGGPHPRSRGFPYPLSAHYSPLKSEEPVISGGCCGPAAEGQVYGMRRGQRFAGRVGGHDPQALLGRAGQTRRKASLLSGLRFTIKDHAPRKPSVAVLEMRGGVGGYGGCFGACACFAVLRTDRPDNTARSGPVAR